MHIPLAAVICCGPLGSYFFLASLHLVQKGVHAQHSGWVVEHPYSRPDTDVTLALDQVCCLGVVSGRGVTVRGTEAVLRQEGPGGAQFPATQFYRKEMSFRDPGQGVKGLSPGSRAAQQSQQCL